MRNYVPCFPLTHTYATDTNAAVTVTLAAEEGVLHVLDGVDWSYSGTPSGGALTVAVDGTTIMSIDITEGGPGFLTWATENSDGLHGPLATATGKAMTVTLASGGAGVVGKLTVHSK